MAALVVVVVSAIVFVALAPLTKFKLDAYPVFIPLNQTALILNDAITALLLFLQLRVTRSHALVVLACGYLYTSQMATAHLLTFPGVFTPHRPAGRWRPIDRLSFCPLARRIPGRCHGLRFHEAQSVAHSARARSTNRRASGNDRARGGSARSIHNAGQRPLPTNAQREHVQLAIQCRALRPMGAHGRGDLAIWMMWRNRTRSVLDLWVMVALCASFIEIGLVAIFNEGRYDVGFYAGRVYALLSSMFVLAVLLVEQGRLYSGVFASRALQRAEAEARANRDVLRLGMAGGGMGAWSLDLVGGKMWVSVEMEGILGFAPGTSRTSPRPLIKRIHREDVSRIRAAIADALASGRDFAVEVRFCHAQRRWRWMDVRGRAGADPQGEGAAVIGVVMDVTAQHEAESALRDIDHRKDEFIAVLAHELRNPLAPIRNAVAMMTLSGPLIPEIERARSIVDRQSQQLSRLVDDLMEVSRITQGKVQLRTARVSVSEVLWADQLTRQLRRRSAGPGQFDDLLAKFRQERLGFWHSRTPLS
jgi:signal transduction histidine kinase